MTSFRRTLASTLILASTVFVATTASAGWVNGKVKIIAFGYNGNETAIMLEGVSLSCNCPTYWGGYICLNRARETYKEEYALVLNAKSRDVKLYVNVDENTCMPTAMYTY